MSYRDPEFRSIQAGEYVLGTLSGPDLVEFCQLLDSDTDLQGLVVGWQEKLQPIALAAGLVNPPPQVWEQLRATLDHKKRSSHAAHYVDQPKTRRRSRQAEKLREKLRVWQWAGGLAMATSALLALVLWQTQTRQADVPEYDFVSVVSSEEVAALWVVNASLDSKQLQITTLAPPEISADEDHQLWLVKPEDGGVISLGLLPKAPNTTVVIDAPQLQADTVALAVSLEPAGGSPEAGPTGPVLYQGGFNQLTRNKPELSTEP